MALVARFVDSIGRIFNPISDRFTRIVANGWGTSDSGHVWLTSGGSAADYSVGSGKGSVSLAAVDTEHITTTGSAIVDVDHFAEITVPVTATGGVIEPSLVARYVDSSNFYQCTLDYDTSGNIDLFILKRVAGSFTTLATVANQIAYTPGVLTKVRFQVIGSTLRVRLWTGTEPAIWHLSATDTTFTSGAVGTRSRLSAANTNTLPVVIDFDNLTVSPLTSVRLDVNDGDLWRLQASHRLDPPPAKRARVSTLLTDGALYPAAAYDDRILELRWLLEADTTDVVAGEMQKLARELDRPNNIFEYRPEGATESTFFRTHRLGLGSVDIPTDGTRQWVEVNVPAEPFGYGLRQVTSATVNNDPAAGSNPQRFEVTGVKGDVPTPMIVRLPGATVETGRTSVAARSRDLTGLHYELQVETGTDGTDTSAPGNDAAMSGSGSNYKRCTFATVTTMTNRVTFTQFPTGAAGAYRGRYRVLLRYRKSVAGDVVKVRLRWGGTADGASILGDIVTLAQKTSLSYADLGVFALPPGVDPLIDGYTGLPLPVNGVLLALQAERTSGTGNLDMDVLVNVPAEQLCFASWDTIVLGAAMPPYATVDGVWQMAYGQDAGGAVGHHAGAGVAGVFPELAPNVTNRVYVIPSVGDVGPADAIGTTMAVQVEWWPRYLVAVSS